MGRAKAAPVNSVRGMRSVVGPGPMALNEMSTPPALSTTVLRCSSTAFSSRASTCAVSTTPPAATISLATASTFATLRPVQEKPCPLACESLRDGATNCAPGRIDHGGLVFEQHFVLQQCVLSLQVDGPIRQY